MNRHECEKGINCREEERVEEMSKHVGWRLVTGIMHIREIVKENI